MDPAKMHRTLRMLITTLSETLAAHTTVQKKPNYEADYFVEAV